MERLSLSVPALIRTVKTYASEDKHAALDDLIEGYISKKIDKKQLQIEVFHVAGRELVKQALVAMVPNIKELQTKRDRRRAASRLELASAGNNAAAVRTALDAAMLIGVDEAVLARGQARIEELATEAARQTRRESLGIAHLATPIEFVCPITYDKMVDPVVASDGHSYERAAITEVIKNGNKVSPLTRELLSPSLFANFNLKSRIRHHDDEQFATAEAAIEENERKRAR